MARPGNILPGVAAAAIAAAQFGIDAMGNDLVVRRNRLPQSPKAGRAAQYVRMSTDFQRYSIENQGAVIATYASMHQLSIIRTYRDEGISGLRLKNRAGLNKLFPDYRTERRGCAGSR
jgi:hypothetical protein